MGCYAVGPGGGPWDLSVHGHATGAHKLSAFRIVHTVSKRIPEVRSPARDSTGLTTRCQNFVPSGSCFYPLTNPPLSLTHAPPQSLVMTLVQAVPPSHECVSVFQAHLEQHQTFCLLHSFSSSQNIDPLHIIHVEQALCHLSVAPALHLPAS